jgi:predicted amidohydrolase
VTIRIACAQLNLPVGDVGGCLDMTTAAITAARAQEADLVVLPELAACGYPLAGTKEARACANASALCLERWMEAADGIMVVGGFCEAAGESIYNSGAILDSSGVRATYRKVHLWDREKLLFAPGDAPPPVVTTGLGRIAIAICYDLEFPELMRDVALSGAALLAVPTAVPFNQRPAGTHPISVTLAMATARLNGIFVAACDHSGTERDVAFDGGSVIVSNTGWLLAGPVPEYGVGLIVADCDLEAAHDKKRGDRNDLFADRRPELYRAQGTL